MAGREFFAKSECALQVSPNSTEKSAAHVAGRKNKRDVGKNLGQLSPVLQPAAVASMHNNLQVGWRCRCGCGQAANCHEPGRKIHIT